MKNIPPPPFALEAWEHLLYDQDSSNRELALTMLQGIMAQGDEQVFQYWFLPPLMVAAAPASYRISLGLKNMDDKQDRHKDLRNKARPVLLDWFEGQSGWHYSLDVFLEKCFSFKDDFLNKLPYFGVENLMQAMMSHFPSYGWPQAAPFWLNVFGQKGFIPRSPSLLKQVQKPFLFWNLAALAEQKQPLPAAEYWGQLLALLPYLRHLRCSTVQLPALSEGLQGLPLQTLHLVLQGHYVAAAEALQPLLLAKPKLRLQVEGTAAQQEEAQPFFAALPIEHLQWNIIRAN